MAGLPDSPDPLPDAPSDFAIVTEERDVAAPPRRPSDMVAPRLGIAHLLVWTACCAVFLGVARLLANRPAGVAGAIFLVLVAVGDGAAWAGLVITLARLLRGKTWPIEPGQWLLALLGVVVAVELTTESGVAGRLRNPQAVVMAAAACALVAPLFSRRLEMRWKWLFGVLSLLYAFPILTSVIDWQIDLPQVVERAASQLTAKRLEATTALGATALAVFDSDRRNRNWLHWAGIVAALWLALMPPIAQRLLSL